MLLEIADLKQLSQQLGVDGIVAGEESIKVTFDEAKTSLDPRKLIRLIEQDRRISITPPARMMIRLRGLEGKALLFELKRILEKLM